MPDKWEWLAILLVGGIGGILVVRKKCDLRQRIALIAFFGIIASVIVFWEESPKVYLIASIGITLLTCCISFFRNYPIEDKELPEFDHKEFRECLFHTLTIMTLILGAFAVVFLVNALNVRAIEGQTANILSQAGDSLTAIGTIVAYCFFGGGLMAIETLLPSKK